MESLSEMTRPGCSLHLARPSRSGCHSGVTRAASLSLSIDHFGRGMRFPPFRTVAAGLIALLFVGCGTVDISSHHVGPAPKCEVHGIVMTPEIIKMSSGEIVYAPEYWKPAYDQFPHHGVWLYQGERPYGRASSSVRDYVCADCNEAFQSYWKEKHK